MNLKKITFKNREGLELAGRIELPPDQRPHNFVLFAHCFTCTKNLTAVRNISNALAAKGFGVLRFDFTGLGESEGDFSDTNFSGNVEDLVDAAKFLADQYSAPALLIGHSLGGAAVIFAAGQINSVEAVATIGAPAEPDHVLHLVQSDLPEIKELGQARVSLGGREFTIKKQFLEDLENTTLADKTKQLRKPLLILHSPQDSTVGVKNAEALYKAAHHPKSFISLDGADHLLSDNKDSLYAGQVIGSWAERYLSKPELPSIDSDHQVVAGLGADDDFTTRMKVGTHFMVADEPASAGGNNLGPSPYELVSAGLAACTAMTLQMYARRKKWPLEEVLVHTTYSKDHAQDCLNCEKEEARLDTFRRLVEFRGELEEKQRERLLEIANKCPVHRTLHGDIQVVTTLSE